MSFLGGLLDGAKSVAPGLVSVAANLVVPGSGNFVNGLIRKVAGVPESTPIEEAAEIVQKDPNLYAQYLMQMGQNEVRFRELDSKDLETVNATMQTEAKSEHWPQWSWRPFNGFMFGISMFSIYVVLPILDGFDSFSIKVPDVDYTTWAAWAAILGVATWDRGKEKRAAAGDRGMGRVSNFVTNLVGKNKGG